MVLHIRKWLGIASVGAVSSMVAVACGSSVEPPPSSNDAGQDATTDVAKPVDFDAATCVPQKLDCTGRCGLLTDPCSGATKHCGGCLPLTAPDGGEPIAQACDFKTNTCGKPKTTCEDLGAECGRVKDSCGNYLDCPVCPDGKECDPDTNKCKDCQAVTCQDLGYECGDAWLGCGDPAKASNRTSCGDCSNTAGRPRCNTAFNVCEPACVPKSAKEICDAAKALKGVQCGMISDGCGGVVDCSVVAGFGCPVGQSCGVRGLANRCDDYEPPIECSLASRNCNPTDLPKNLKSACTGQTLDCGSCTAPQVCNDNGVCGAPCTPKKCADLGNPQCGTFDDGCSGKVICGPCPGGSVCKEDTKTCCTKKTCAVDYAGQCGTGFDDGCGGKMDCNVCNGTTEKCIVGQPNTTTPPSGTPGSCCTKKTCNDYVAQFGAAMCGRQLSDGCGGTINCGACSANNYALCTVPDGAGGQKQTAAGEVGSCCARNACTSCTDIPDNCRAVGALIDCAGFGACGGGQVCGGVNKDACCAPPACGTAADGKQLCSAVTNACTTNACKCPNGDSCIANYLGSGASACCKKKTCSGICGTDLDDACGGKLSNCACAAGQVCSSSTPGTPGTCACPVGTPYNCNNVPGKPLDACGTYSNGCGGTLTCNCAAGVCNKPGGSPTGTCCAPSVCPVPALGAECGTFSNGCGGTRTCGCPTPPASRFQCVAGKCACTPRTVAQCGTDTGLQDDGCGGKILCGG